MKVSNSIILCEYEMKRAIQHYLDSVLFKEKSESIVTGIKSEMENGSNVFRIILLENKNIKDTKTIEQIDKIFEKEE